MLGVAREVFMCAEDGVFDRRRAVADREACGEAAFEEVTEMMGDRAGQRDARYSSGFGGFGDAENGFAGGGLCVESALAGEA